MFIYVMNIDAWIIIKRVKKRHMVTITLSMWYFTASTKKIFKRLVSIITPSTWIILKACSLFEYVCLTWLQLISCLCSEMIKCDILLISDVCLAYKYVYDPMILIWYMYFTIFLMTRHEKHTSIKRSIKIMTYKIWVW